MGEVVRASICGAAKKEAAHCVRPEEERWPCYKGAVRVTWMCVVQSVAMCRASGIDMIVRCASLRTQRRLARRPDAIEASWLGDAQYSRRPAA